MGETWVINNISIAYRLETEVEDKSMTETQAVRKIK
jgi:hypothetical protein